MHTTSSSEPPYTNHLIDEQSPYLLQHAHNPVDWYPWGEEAFAKARQEGKPIFLSIGYSTCHWCHVMERESFEDPEVAAAVNETFVSIKVDREERPDIDHVYMTVCQMLTGSGGWPLTVIMTPDKQPFFAGTYFPRQSRHGRIGMLELAPRIKELWRDQRDDILSSVQRINASLTAAVGSSTTPGEDVFTAGILDRAQRGLEQNYDEVYGGFGSAPKFPSPHNLLFLLRYWKRTGQAKALEMVETTLQQMRQGGMYDQVGFGFHRYSTDRHWLLPHFEKMLYDQAMLTMAYTEAFLATGNEDYRSTAEEILTYVLRDMTDDRGGFYSAEDADSEGIEGKFYVWTEAEIREVLDRTEADLIVNLFGVEAEGNFAEEASGRKNGANVLHLKAPLKVALQRVNLPFEEARQRVVTALKKLYVHRERRIHPYKDDKILTDWNGLMIAALAKAAAAFDQPKYSEAAGRAIEFIRDQMQTGEGRLLHRYRSGEAGIAGHLDDYAFLIWGLIEQYEATLEARYLCEAVELNRVMIQHFRDAASGAFFFSPDDGEELLVRYKEIYDGAIPSGNSVAAYNLIRLARLTGDMELEEQAGTIGRAFAQQLERAPSIATMLLCAAEFGAGASYEIVITGEEEDVSAMIKAVQTRYLPGAVWIFRPERDDTGIADLAEYTRDQVSTEGRATAYVCQNFRCHLPTNDIPEMLRLLGEGKDPEAGQGR